MSLSGEMRLQVSQGVVAYDWDTSTSLLGRHAYPHAGVPASTLAYIHTYIPTLTTCTVVETQC
jgi:hypothetical protein